MTVTVRFAPSPTGKIHLGNIRAALVNWLFAKQQGGAFLLRIDDTDRERSTKENEEAIRADLAWLGLTWNDTFNQSDRFERYDEVVAKMKADGRLYPCYETPDELEIKRKIQLSRGLPPVYDRAALNLTDSEKATYAQEGRLPHWRFKLDVPGKADWTDLVRGPVSIDLAHVSDPILVRADGSYLYTLPSCVDDVDYGVTHIVRGEDHVTNSAVQLQIFDYLGGTRPEMAHFALLTGKDGEGLSKRKGSLSIEALRDEMGLEPMAVLSLMAKLGTSDPIEPQVDVAPLVESFAFNKFGRSAAKLDPAELETLNAKILHATSYDVVADRLPGLGEEFWTVVRANIDKLSDVAVWKQMVDGPVTPIVEDADFLSVAASLLPEGAVDTGTWSIWTTAVKTETGAKGKALFMPLRKAITGAERGPDMASLIPLIGRDKIIERLAGKEA